jgi:hypothetical protein
VYLVNKMHILLFYSLLADQAYGLTIYKTPDGNKCVTFLVDYDEQKGMDSKNYGYKWENTQLIGKYLESEIVCVKANKKLNHLYPSSIQNINLTF